MNDNLGPEPEDDADAVFRNFMRHNLANAADHFGLTVTGAPKFGWRLRSIGARARGGGDERWLRVVSAEPPWAQGNAWTGNIDTNAITGVPRPRVLEVYEWSERDWRNQRAEVLTLMPGQPCSPSDVLRREPKLTESWWSELRRAFDKVAATPTLRVHADQDRVTARIRERFSDTVDTAVSEWATGHGDVHWANLLHTPLGLLDWELWGRAPAGTDAATLLCYSLLVPATADRIRCLFADLLSTPTGRVAQLYVIARLLRRIDSGDRPDLAEPLTRHAESLSLGHCCR